MSKKYLQLLQLETDYSFHKNWNLPLYCRIYEKKIYETRKMEIYSNPVATGPTLIQRFGLD